MYEHVGSVRMPSATRAEFDDAVTEADLHAMVKLPRLKTLQCSATVKEELWSLLDDVFFSRRPDVELRVYGHYSSVCDLAFAQELTHVRRFAADCLQSAKNVDAIAAMRQLEALSLGILDLQDFSLLEKVPATLTTLVLGETRSKKPHLEPLGRLRALRVLSIHGHNKGIDVLGTLRNLEQLTLRAVTTADLNFLAPLQRLWSLAIKLGGIASFGGIEGKESLKYLELWQIRGLGDVDIVASLPGLQRLFLQSLPLVKALPRLDGNHDLRRVVLENLRGCVDFSALETASALEEFALIQGERQQPEQLLPVLRNPAVRGAAAFFGSQRRNQEFERMRDAHGKTDWDLSTPFEYR